VACFNALSRNLPGGILESLGQDEQTRTGSGTRCSEELVFTETPLQIDFCFSPFWSTFTSAWVPTGPNLVIMDGFICCYENNKNIVLLLYVANSISYRSILELIINQIGIERTNYLSTYILEFFRHSSLYLQENETLKLI
jgi:hypothetical protein